MTTSDADSGWRSGLEDSLPRRPQAAEPELDAHGLPVENRRPGRTYRLELAGLACALCSMCLAIMDIAANGNWQTCPERGSRRWVRHAAVLHKQNGRWSAQPYCTARHRWEATGTEPHRQ
jgi:hypothetical protein